MASLAAGKRERDPICDVCGHNHVQGVKCEICGHVGKYIVPGGPNRPNRGAIPPVPPGPLHAPNLTPPTIEGCTVANFQQVRCTQRRASRDSSPEGPFLAMLILLARL